MRAALLLAWVACCAQDIVTVRPTQIDDVLINPGIGFMTFQRFNGDALNEGKKWTEGYPIVYQPFHGSLKNTGYPDTSLAYFRIYWKFLEPEQGKYRWELIDTALQTAHDRKQTLLLRIAPYGTDKETDVPDWYRAALGDETGKLPVAKWRTNPEDSRYAERFGGFIREAGRRYDGHPDLDSVDLSIVGAWGEGAGVQPRVQHGQEGRPVGLQRADAGAGLLPQGLHRRLNQGAVGVPRLPVALHRQARPGPGRIDG